MAITRDQIRGLYARYGVAIRRRIRSFYRNPEEVDDVLQEVFLRALDKGDSFQGNSSPYTWLYQLTTRYCINRVRNGRRRLELAQQVGDVLFWSQAVTEPEAEHGVLLHELAAQLDEQQLMIATLYYMDDMSHQQISDLIGVSRRTIGNRLQQITEAVRLAAGVTG